MAAGHPTPMSASTRRRLLDYIVNKHLGLNYVDPWSAVHSASIAKAMREWSLDRAPGLRAELEAMSDHALWNAYDVSNVCSEWMLVLGMMVEHQKQQQDIDSAARILGRRGGRKHRSESQPDIIPAIQEMIANCPGITSTSARKKLTSGYKMLDGRFVKFKGGDRSFERYWREASLPGQRKRRRKKVPQKALSA
jgi:hypothetical protein